MKYFFAIGILGIFFLSIEGNAQKTSLTVIYIISEHSKDSHSSSETYALDGKTLQYAVEYTGRRGPKQKDSEKSCTLTDEQVSNIWKKVSEKHLDQNDSVTANDLNGSNFSTTSLLVAVTKGKTICRVTVRGSTALIGSKDLFKSAYTLYAYLQMQMKECN